jgi:REP element-mobilizing transposase RayT
MSYTKTLYHIVLRPYRSESVIDEKYERELYGYIWGFCKSKKATLIRVGGMPDHVHLLVALPATIALAKFVQELKVSTSKWLKSNIHFPKFVCWSKEYAGFTCSYWDRTTIANYIRRQKMHHQHVTFRDEHREFLAQNGVVVDDRFFMTD